MKTKKTTMDLPCKLTEAELKDYSRKLAKTLADRDEVEANLKEFSSKMKSRIEEHENTIAMLADKLNTEKEWRTVDCVVESDFEKGTKNTFRSDTGEQVKTEIMLESERQQEMFATEK